MCIRDRVIPARYRQSRSRINRTKHECPVAEPPGTRGGADEARSNACVRTVLDHGAPTAAEHPCGDEHTDHREPDLQDQLDPVDAAGLLRPDVPGDPGAEQGGEGADDDCHEDGDALPTRREEPSEETDDGPDDDGADDAADTQGSAPSVDCPGHR